MKKTFAVLSALALASVALVGCSSESAPAADCLTVEDSMLQAIADGTSGNPIKPIKGAAAKDGELYVIAMSFNEGHEDLTGLWASGSLEPGGSVIGAADGIAKEFTNWPDAKGSPWQVSSADKVSEDAKKCLG